MASDLLEREFVRLRSERVQLRREIEITQDRMRLLAGGGNYYELRRHAEVMAMRLKGTEPRWRELEALLRKPSGKPVRLNAPVRRQAPRPTIRAGTPYLTRAMRSG